MAIRGAAAVHAPGSLEEKGLSAALDGPGRRRVPLLQRMAGNGLCGEVDPAPLEESFLEMLAGLLRLDARYGGTCGPRLRARAVGPL